MTIFQWIGLFLLVSFFSVSGCSGVHAEWENLYSMDAEETESSTVWDGVSEGALAETINSTDEDEQDILEKTEEEIPATVQVYVCGAVVSPGVYELPAGARINRAIEAAGGLAEDADLLLVNQAKVVEDGEQIRIYTKEEAAAAELEISQKIKNGGQTGADAKGDIRININEASVEMLMTLPGIGEAKASAIIEYRQINGPFQMIEDIMNIPGIKEAVFSKIKDQITV